MKANYFTLLALLLGLAACTQDELSNGTLPEGRYPVVIQANGLSAVATPFAAPSRTTVDGDWQGVTTVAVKIGDEVKGYTVTASDTDGYKRATLSRENDPFWWTSRNPITVSAWWPLDDADITRMPAVKVAEDQSKLADFQNSDFISAIDQTVEFDDPTLEFTHRTARVVVELKPGTGFTSVAGATVSLVSLSADNGNPTAITTCNTAGETHEALAAPQTVAAGKPFIEVKLGEGTFYFRPQDDVVLEAGYRYTYTVNVNATGLTLASCEIGGWEPGQGESGVAEIVDYFYDESSNTFIVYTDKGLLAWNEAAQSDLTLNCTLAADIDLTAIDWTPVGNYDTPYTGTFDGGGHTITGLTVTTSDQYAGLFGYIGEEGTVMNLTLTDIQIEIESNNRSVYAGGVAGYNAGTVTDCHTTGSVSGTGSSSYGSVYTGGVAGYNKGGTVTGCHTTGSVSGTGGSDCSVCAGGVVGLNYGTVTGCYATGDVSGTGGSSGHVYTGGVVGENDGTVTGCYATGDVSGTGRFNFSSVNVGGVVGDNNGTVTGCYHATGKVSGTNRVGGVVGLNFNDTVTGCYWSDYDGNGIGYDSGSGETTKVNGTDVTWETAQSGMNIAIDAWNSSHSDNPCNWHYEGATATTLPTLVESSNP